MERDRERLPLRCTAVVAKNKFMGIMERIRTRGDRFLIVHYQRKRPDAIIIGIDDFLELSGLTEQWLEDSWKANRNE